MDIRSFVWILTDQSLFTATHNEEVARMNGATAATRRLFYRIKSHRLPMWVPLYKKRMCPHQGCARSKCTHIHVLWTCKCAQIMRGELPRQWRNMDWLSPNGSKKTAIFGWKIPHIPPNIANHAILSERNETKVYWK